MSVSEAYWNSWGLRKATMICALGLPSLPMQITLGERRIAKSCKFYLFIYIASTVLKEKKQKKNS